MRDVVHGFVAAALDAARRERRLDRIVGELEVFSRAMVESEELREVLSDSGVPLVSRRAVAKDLVAKRAAPETATIVWYLIGAERPAELSLALAQARVLATDQRDAGDDAAIDTGGGRLAAMDRLRGYADFSFSQLSKLSDVDLIEDELFRLARAVEEYPELAAALSDRVVPLAARSAVLASLLAGRAAPTTGHLGGYVLRAGKVRDLVRAFDYLVELAAEERGRRIADVRAAKPLDDEQRDRLAAALGAMAGRPVEVRVVVDPQVIGGLHVSIGDTVIDGTVRHRLDQLGESLGGSATSAA